MDVLTELKEADVVLVGLGEEWDDIGRLRSCAGYAEGKEALQESGHHSLVPAWRERCSERLPDVLSPALQKLRELLEGKNFFVVSVATDKRILQGIRGDRLVMPCGTAQRKQCASGCRDVLAELTGEDKAALNRFFDEVYGGRRPLPEGSPVLGSCPECGAAMVLNNVFAENYNEQGYMPQWERYTKWLQGTLNRKLAVLELGVGMQFPSVIRWPFEKAAYFNRRASFVRVHEMLYQLTEELSGKGCGISQNAIEWLGNLC